MRLGLFGDIVGRAGRTLLLERLPGLRKKFDLDFVVVNAENAAGGFGVNRRICHDLFDAGADVLTTGNHAFDQRDEINIFNEEDNLLRPLNFPASNPGRGAVLCPLPSGQQVLVLHAQGQIGMHPCDDPFAAVDSALGTIELGREVDAIILDFHAEATSEKQAIGHLLDGRVSAVVGTHTHCPTADARVLAGGTAYMTDLGMCGDYNSVIGMQKDEPISRFVTKMGSGRFQPASGDATLCGLVVETDKTGRSTHCEPIRIGGCLSQARPAAKSSA